MDIASSVHAKELPRGDSGEMPMLKRELTLFLVVGISSVLVDFLVYSAIDLRLDFVAI
jgi:hypothetical protein